MNTDQRQIREGIAQKGSPRLGAVPLVPVGFPYPVAKFSLVPFGHPHQADGADKIAIQLSCYGKCDALIPVEDVLMLANPFLRHSLLVGVRYVERCVRDRSFSCQSHHICSVGDHERPKTESRRRKLRNLFHALSANARGEPRSNVQCASRCYPPGAQRPAWRTKPARRSVRRGKARSQALAKLSRSRTQPERTVESLRGGEAVNCPPRPTSPSSSTWPWTWHSRGSSR